MKRFLRLTFFLLLSGSTVSVYATNGYFSHGYGIKYKGLAGAGVAMYLSPMAAATNPATLVFGGKAFDVTLSFFNPNRQYTVSGAPSGVQGTFGLTPGTVESDSRLFLVPSLAANWMLSERVSFGLALYGNGGMNTNYPTNTFYASSPTGVNLMQLFIAPTLSIMLSERHGIGVTPVLAFQRFEAKGLKAFANFSSRPNSVSDNGADNSTGFGARIGYFGQWLDFLAVGASYQTTVSMSEFSNYAGLFAGNGNFDIPANWTVGVAFGYEGMALLFDVQKIMFSQVKSVGNPMLPNLMQAKLGQDNGAGFGWKDMTVFKIGAQLQTSEAWTWRAGFSFGDQPIPESEVLFNILAPAVIGKHLTFGFTRLLGEKQLNVSITRALSGSVKGVNPLDPPANQTIELKMDQWEIGVGLTF